MKLRRIFAALAACAIAAVSVISASAANAPVTSGYGIEDDGKGNWKIVVKGNEKFGNIDPSKIASMDVTLSFTCEGDSWVGGKVIVSSSANSWDELGAWCVYEDSTKEFDDVKTGEAFNVPLKNAIPADVEYFNVVFQNYSTDKNGNVTYNVDKIVFKDKDGKVIEAAANNNNNSSNNNSNNNGDKKDNSNKPTGASAGLALAGLALAGVAVVATKKSK